MSRYKSVALAFALCGCASLEPAGGTHTTFVYSPYASTGQPNPLRNDVDMTGRAAQRPLDLPIAGPLPQPNVAVHPPRPAVRHLAGPVRICKWGMSVDVLDKEKAFEDLPSVLVQGDGFSLTVEGWRYEPLRDEALIQPAGNVTLPDGREAKLFELTRPDPTYPRFAYVFAAGKNSSSAEWSVRSASFEGTKKDFKWLSRVKFGEAARLACTSAHRG